MAILSLVFLIEMIFPGTRTSRYSLVVILLLLGVPHMVLIFYICYVLAKKVGITQCLKRKYNSLKRCALAIRCTSPAEADVEADSDIDSLPDRLVNPGAYEPLLHTGESHAAKPTESKQRVNEDPLRLSLVYSYGTVN